MRINREHSSPLFFFFALFFLLVASPLHAELRSLKTGLDSAPIALLKMVLKTQGMYRVSGRDLSAAGVQLDEVDPARVRLLYGGGRPLPLSLAEARDGLEEIACIVEDGGDGRFDEEDFLAFYGEPTSRWVYEEDRVHYQKNLYTRENVYWLEIGGATKGKRAALRSGHLGDSNPQVPKSYRVRTHTESEESILLRTFGISSGYEWYWQEFANEGRDFSIAIDHAVNAPMKIRLRFFAVISPAGRLPLNRFNIRWNNRSIGRLSFEKEPSFTTELEADEGAREGLNKLTLIHSGYIARLDWYELEYSRQFVAKNGDLIFTSPVAAGMAEFHLEGFAAERPRIFEFSRDLVEIDAFEYDAQTGTVVFQDEGNASPRRYLAAGPSRWQRPLRIELDSPGLLQGNGNGADYLIITHRDFAAAAERLAAWRAEDDRFGPPLQTTVVDVEDIYDEFSNGLLDPAAIRNFLQHAFEEWNPAPFFVVLLGDGSYDYKNNSGTSSGNWIPPFQDGESTYDDWYVRVAGDDELPDMAIGRLTVQTAAEADLVVDKLIDYDRMPEAGPWQSRVLLVTDDLRNPKDLDLEETYFVKDSELLAAESLPQELDLVKHYIAQYPLEGRTKPRARDEFIRLFNEGAVLLTYVGHGNPETLAHEHMFLLSRDFGAIANGRRLPFVYTAASQIGVFDDPVRAAMPELMLKKSDGGIIGMISATRVGFHATNMVLARAFHEQMYRSGRSHVPLGQALTEAKRLIWDKLTPQGRIIVQRYALIGDPATRLALPPYGVELEVADTLRALAEIQIQGRVLTAEGKPATTYSGQALVQAFDSSVGSFFPTPGKNTKLDKLPYEKMGGPLFRGLFPVQKGRFEAAFRVPKDITYRGVNGRISAYLWAEGWPAAFGAVEGLSLAGTAEEVIADHQGPRIDIGFAGQEPFQTGSFVPRHPLLRTAIWDESGINVTGETGHEIVLYIDGITYPVTRFFTSTGGDYRGGILEYLLPELTPGPHAIGLKAWDTFNNSARTQVEVQVGEGGITLLSDLLFHPNPLRGNRGHFTYNLLAPASAVQIHVFSLGGKQVDELEGTTQLGYNQIEWKPDENLANGTYLYRIQVSDEAEKAKKVQKFAPLQIIK